MNDFTVNWIGDPLTVFCEDGSDLIEIYSLSEFPAKVECFIGGEMVGIIPVNSSSFMGIKLCLRFSCKRGFWLCSQSAKYSTSVTLIGPLNSERSSYRYRAYWVPLKWFLQ